MLIQERRAVGSCTTCCQADTDMSGERRRGLDWGDEGFSCKAGESL